MPNDHMKYKSRKLQYKEVWKSKTQTADEAEKGEKINIVS